jgi:hypothetical protein
MYSSAYCQPSPKIEKREKDYSLILKIVEKLIYIEENQLISWSLRSNHPVQVVLSVSEIGKPIPDYLTKSYFKQFELL